MITESGQEANSEERNSSVFVRQGKNPSKVFECVPLKVFSGDSPRDYSVGQRADGEMP